jgi:hypothetical protein
MTDDNMLGIDGRQAAQLRKDLAEREKREEVLRQKLKCVGFKLQPARQLHDRAPAPARSRHILKGGATIVGASRGCHIRH